MRPSSSETASMIFPSTMRPVFERRAIREASSSVRLRNRSRNDIESLWLQGSRDKASDTAIRDFRLLHDHAVANDPVVFSAGDLVFAWKHGRGVGEREASGGRIVRLRRKPGLTDD